MVASLGGVEHLDEGAVGRVADGDGLVVSPGSFLRVGLGAVVLGAAIVLCIVIFGAFILGTVAP